MDKPASLTYQDGNGAEHAIEIKQRVFRIGRIAQNNLSFNNPYISRLHAQIVIEGSRYSLYDLESTFGTYVNDEPVRQCTLHDGDRIKLGRKPSIELVFHAGALPPTALCNDWENGQPLRPVREVAPENTRFINAQMLPATADLPADTVDRLRALYEFTSTLLTVQSSKELSEQLAEFLHRVLEADRCAVLLWDRLSASLEVISSFPKEREVVPSRTIADRVYKENIALLSVDADQDTRFARGDSIRRQSIHSVLCVPIGSKTRVWGVCYVDNETTARAFDDEELEFSVAVARQVGLMMENLHLLEEQQRLIESFIRTLAASIDARDDLTAGHSARVGAYSAGIARVLGLSSAQCRLISFAGLLHDYGKIGVRDDVLLKPAKLTDDEREKVKQHAEHTYRILSKVRFPEELADIPLIAASHHERWDGAGYPHGLKGDEIPLGSRIIMVADAFDALAESRPYSNAMPAEEAVAQIVSCAGTHFDPQVVESFIQYFETNLKAD